MQSNQVNSNLISSLFITLFRIGFGIIMILQTASLVPFVHDLQNSTFVFHYPYLSWIEAYSHELIDCLAFGAYLSAAFITIGIFTRIASFIFMLCFGYLFLIDMSFFNNHYYLWCLISFLFIFIKWENTYTIFNFYKFGTLKKVISYQEHLPLAILLAIVYFYGGVAKLNGDWLQGYPMRMLAESRNYPFPDFTGIFMSYFGLIFDFCIPFLIFRKLLKWYVLLPYLGFHTINYFVFDIGEFPIVMILAITIFYPLQDKAIISEFIVKIKQSNLIPKYGLILFFTFQFLFPLKTFIMRNGIAWHRQGHYFSWRMMLDTETPKYFQFRVELVDLKDSYFVDFQKLLTYRQLHNTFNDPYFIWLLAQKLEKDAIRKYKTKNVKVFSRSYVKLNQHAPRDLIKINVDLSETNYHLFSENEFINY